ncbi:murein L,D-transpeptidase [Nocardioides guangzhouensis]|uniref:Murein L,D-transpeptidase n=1 Tax=Nocardioides guangzhouensis TaxID=2497878 RepID=A0A4Q4Z0U3_9ACTN|nr:L,D-transpeptidase [Nocardioides guangzhouensis]RYP81177.1 murein L,D-transpeptidase [Nocardioides guangzhouensis]
MSRHRLEVRPRYGRIAVLGLSVVVTGISVLGGIGLLPQEAGSPAASAEDSLFIPGNASTSSGRGEERAALAAEETGPARDNPDDSSGPAAAQVPTKAPAAATRRTNRADRNDVARDWLADLDLPADSGYGRRVVFSEEQQRVWLVDADGDVRRTYLVSGSLTDNLDPGTYAVYSRSERAYGIDDSGTMKWFVRFTRGDNAAIGFHDIPVRNGKPLQTAAELGTPRSHGCIRQKEADARALWAFAPLDTTVVVV